jgi:hypothetical protein
MSNYIKVLPNVEVGSLQIHRGIDQGLYSDQSGAKSYLTEAIDGICSKIYLDVSNDVLFFDVPQGTYTFKGFLSETSAYIVQLNNLLQYGDDCFNQNSGNNIIDGLGANIYFGNGCFANSTGNNYISRAIVGKKGYEKKEFFKNSSGNNTIDYCEAADVAFADSSGNNKIGEFIGRDECFALSSGNNTIGNGTFGQNAFVGAASSLNTITNIIDAGDNFGKGYIGNFMIRGNIGATNSADLTGTETFFARESESESGANLIVQSRKATSNEGNPEGDLNNARNNTARITYVLI